MIAPIEQRDADGLSAQHLRRREAADECGDGEQGRPFAERQRHFCGMMDWEQNVQR